MQRKLHLHSSALSPYEYDLYWATLVAFSRQRAPGTPPPTPNEIWTWLSSRLSTHDPSRQAEILSFFRGAPPDVDDDGTGTLLALLRLVAHAQSSKHLTRDHVFLQTEPVALADDALAAQDAAPSNPFRRSMSSSQLEQYQHQPPASPTSPIAGPPRRVPPPPLPTKRRPPTPPASISPDNVQPRSVSGNPFRARLPSAPTDPSTFPVSPPASIAGNWEPPIISPPLPPRPSSEKLFVSRPPPVRKSSKVDISTPVPPPPLRRPTATSSHSVPLFAPRMSIISSSSSSASSSKHLAPSTSSPTIAPKPRSTLVSSTHIGPSTKLRSTPSPVPPEEYHHNIPGRTTRSNSSVSASSLQTNSHTAAMHNAGAGLGQSAYVYAPATSPTKKPHVGLGVPSTSSSSRIWPPPTSISSSSSSSGGDDDTYSVATAPTPSTSAHSTSAPRHVSLGSGSTTLGRSRTLGSKPFPPPPPKRRPESMSFGSSPNPFAASGMGGARVPPSATSSAPGHHRSPSLSSTSQFSTSARSVGSGTGNAGGGGGRANDLAALGQDLTQLLEKGGRQSEEWLVKAREQMNSRRLKSGGGGGKAEEKERLVKRGYAARREEGESPFGDGEEGGEVDDLEGEYEEEGFASRREVEKDGIRGREEGWISLDDGNVR